MDILAQPFVWGLALGLLFFGLSFFSHLKTKVELRRYKKLLSDKLEIEAESTLSARRERDALKAENENLRARVHQLGDKPDAKLQRELEILARAEKAMMIHAPGFAPAWENAKSSAAAELEAEDRGATLPKRIFRKFFGGQGEAKDAELIEALPDHGHDGEGADEEADHKAAATAGKES